MKRKRPQNLGPGRSELERREALLTEISEALVSHPDLRVSDGSRFPIVVEGRFVLESSRGPFDAYSLRIEIGDGFPLQPPAVSEADGRIPCDIDRHTSSGFCLEVWPVWLANNPRPTFRDVLEGPIRNFLLSQTVFEQKGVWPFGERAHGDAGSIDAISELVGVDPPDFWKAAAITVALYEWPKGHTSCPCGSGARFRSCHRPQLEALRNRLPKEVLVHLVATVVDIHKRFEKRNAA